MEYFAKSVPSKRAEGTWNSKRFNSSPKPVPPPPKSTHLCLKKLSVPKKQRLDSSPVVACASLDSRRRYFLKKKRGGGGKVEVGMLREFVCVCVC